jgi:hypothetical protein
MFNVRQLSHFVRVTVTRMEAWLFQYIQPTSLAKHNSSPDFEGEKFVIAEPMIIGEFSSRPIAPISFNQFWSGTRLKNSKGRSASRV